VTSEQAISSGKSKFQKLASNEHGDPVARLRRPMVPGTFRKDLDPPSHEK
jgi:hypothetical protein